MFPQWTASGWTGRRGLNVLRPVAGAIEPAPDSVTMQRMVENLVKEKILRLKHVKHKHAQVPMTFSRCEGFFKG